MSNLTKPFWKKLGVDLVNVSEDGYEIDSIGCLVDLYEEDEIQDYNTLIKGCKNSKCYWVDMLQSGTECPQCKEERKGYYCFRCGKQLPLPSNVDLLLAREVVTTVAQCNHERSKEIGHIFCPICGKNT